jgi:hypothetical protein
MSTKTLPLLVALLGAMSGCESAENAPPVSCDPFTIETTPITLGQVVAVGKDAAGVLYVIDRPQGGQLRAFVSEQQTLARRRMQGTGESGSGEGSWMIVTFQQGGMIVNLQVEFGAAGPRAMGLVRGPLPGKTFTIGQEGETLQVMGPQALQGLAVMNLPGTVVVEHFGKTADGRMVWVTSPAVDPTYEKFRLFFGPPERVLERPVVKVGRTLGGVTEIDFVVDSLPARAVFSSTLSPNVPATLKVGSREEPLDDSVPASATLSAAFFCPAS